MGERHDFDGLLRIGEFQMRTRHKSPVRITEQPERTLEIRRIRGLAAFALLRPCTSRPAAYPAYHGDGLVIVYRAYHNADGMTIESSHLFIYQPRLRY
jgi:hypothetical protein